MIYEYACPTCGVFELTRRLADPRVTACPTCDSPVERFYSSAPALKFTGGGFHFDMNSGLSRVPTFSGRGERVDNVPAQIGRAERGRHALRD